MIALKIAGVIIGVYAGVKIGKIGIEWMSEGFEAMRPRNRRRRNKDGWE